MKNWFVFFLLLSGVSIAATPVDLSVLPDGVEQVDIWLLLGQSNMKGRGEIPETQVEDPLIVNMNMDDDQWYVAEHPLHKAGVPDLIDGSDNAGVGPGLDFARGVLSRTNGVRIALVPCALGGSWINLWQPGRDLYTNAIYRAQKALADAPSGEGRIAGVLWLQGESDAIEARYAAYSEKLSVLVQGLRSDLNQPDLPFLACTIGTFINSNNYPYVEDINNALLTLPEREPYTACVDARDLTGHIGDNMHYNTDSQIIIGGRYATAYAEMTEPDDGWNTLVNETFDAGQGGWATRCAEGNVRFTNGVVSITPNINGQPGAAYISYAPVTLADGETLRLSVDVSATQTSAGRRNIRIGLGSASPAIAGDSALISVPFSGYLATLPLGDDNTDSRITWNSAASGDINFFNNATATVGDLGLDDSLYVDSTPKEWILDIMRVGDTLQFSGSFDGSAFSGTVPTASGDNLLSDFTFNTLGLAYAYSPGETAVYDNVRLEVSSSATVSNAPVQLAAPFSSGAVLQRDQTVAVWGSGIADETVTVMVHGQEQTAVADSNGTWRVELTPESAGGPYDLTVSASQSTSIILTNIYFGDVWLLCGQSNMEQSLESQSANYPGYYSEMPNASDDFDDICFAQVGQVQLTEGPADDVIMQVPWNRWEASALADMSAAGYFFARELNSVLDANGLDTVPLGFIKLCKGATAAEQWVSSDALDAMSEPLIARADKPASSWYNGMVAPMQDFAVKGVLWYQGEANTDTMDRIEQYPLVFETLVDSWREQWNNPDLPFYFVQLAPFRAGSVVPADGDWAWMRESQTECLSISNTAMACIIDSGIQGDIHPPFKDRVGKRLARIALDKTYGIPTVCRGPVVQDVEIDGSEVFITFDNVAAGLETRAVDSQPDDEEAVAVSISADELGGFALCGSDQVFYWATEAEIIGSNQVRIANTVDVPNPVFVRYAWVKYPRCNLYNSEGLPAEPFRTDSYGFGTSGGAEASPVNLYLSWASRHRLFGGAEGDDDGDALNNLSEYALGGNPTNADAAVVLPRFQTSETHFYYIHNERTDDPALKYTIEFCSSLVSNDWKTNGVEFVGLADFSNDWKTVTNRIPMLSEDQQFLRLKIEGQG